MSPRTTARTHTHSHRSRSRRKSQRSGSELATHSQDHQNIREDVLDILELLKTEGRGARNVVSFSVNHNLTPNLTPHETESDALSAASGIGDNGDGEFTTVKRRGSKKSSLIKSKSVSAGLDSRRRSDTSERASSQDSLRGKQSLRRSLKSPNRPKKILSDHARLWNMLLAQLTKSVDAIYEACEVDESRLQCEEVIGVLSTAQDDFTALIKRFQIHSEFEKAVDDGWKPTSLAWSVRKISPAHPQQGPVRSYTSSSLTSYADSVKGAAARPIQANLAEAFQSSSDDEDHSTQGESPIRTLPSDSDPESNTPIDHSESTAGIVTAPMHVPGVDAIPLDDENDNMLFNRSTSPFRWADAVDTDTGSAIEDSLADCTSPPLYAVSPGGSVLLHQKLSSPFRKRSVTEHTRITMNEKQLRALKKREQIHQEKQDKLRAENTAKVRAVKVRREDKERRTYAVLEEKMQRAHELRDSHLKEKIQKAQVEDAKIHEIAFINKLEEENKKLEVNDKLNESQERLNEIEEERQRKVLAQAAKQDAAALRREAMEAERLARIRHQEERRLAREEELKRRAEEDLQRRASGGRDRSTTPRPTTSSGRVSDLDNGTREGSSPVRTRKRSASEGRTPTPALLQRPPPPEKAGKRRMKRALQRFLDISDGSVTEKVKSRSDRKVVLDRVHEPIAKILRKILSLSSISEKPHSASTANAIEQSILRLQKQIQDRFPKLSINDRVSVCRAIAASLATFIIDPAEKGAQSAKAVRISYEILLSCSERGESNIYSVAFVPGGACVLLVDTFVSCIQSRCKQESYREGTAVSSLFIMRCFRALFRGDIDDKVKTSNPEQIREDILLYCSANRLLESIKEFFLWVSPSTIENDITISRLTENSLQIVSILTDCDCGRKRRASHSVFFSTVHQNDLVGIASMLYGIVMHCGQRRQPTAIKLTLTMSSIVLLGLAALNHMASFDRKQFQQTSGIQPTCLSVCHVLARLIGYCTQVDRDTTMHHTDILHESILLVGEFTVCNPTNQAMLHVGGSATILPMLCSLPFKYFSDERLKDILFPTLLASCHGCNRNTEVLRKELNCTLIVTYIDEQLAIPSGVRKVGETYRFSCSRRFPRELMSDAKDYFKSFVY